MAITLHEKISESATTAVYRAYDETLRRDVLLKVLHRHLAHDEQVSQRFVREARACAALHSENIVQVYELREHEGSPAIVMEFVNGPSLKDVIEAGNQRTYEFAEKVAVQVLRGLAVAHAQGIIHRDIKPGNILVSPTGTLKITDFGLAQITLTPTLTTDGMIVGTPAYFAPEIIRGEPADARSDLFSLGATIAETLTGVRLFEGATYSECLNRIALFTTEKLDALATSSSLEFVSFLKKLMDPDRERRFASPSEALAALKTGASSQFAFPRASRLNPGKSRRVILGIGLLAFLTVAGVYLFVRWSAAEPATPATVPPVTQELPTVPAETAAEALKEESTTSQNSDQPPIIQGSPSSGEVRHATPVMDFGSLELSGTQGAKVHVDDKPIGELPLKEPLRVGVGAHTVVFMRPPFEPIVRVVQVEPGKKVSATADFLENAGYLRCTAKPWAEISVDDLYRDTTPFDRPIPVSAGTHQVRFHHPSYRDSVWKMSIAPRETLIATVIFKP